MSSIVIKEISENEIQELTNLHLDVFKQFSGAKLGRLYVSKMFHWFFSYPNAINLIAYDNNKIAGYVFGAPVGYRAKLRKDLFPYVVLGMLTQPSIIFNSKFIKDLIRQISEYISIKKTNDNSINLSKPIFSLVGIGVERNHRGKGVGKLLIITLTEIVREQGFKSIRLSVHNQNEEAISLYRRIGWIEIEHPNPNLKYFAEELW